MSIIVILKIAKIIAEYFTVNIQVIKIIITH